MAKLHEMDQAKRPAKLQKGRKKLMGKKIKSGKFIKQLRKETGLTQTKFGEAINLSQGNVSDIEKNRYDVTLSKFIKWCEVFEIKDYNKILK